MFLLVYFLLFLIYRPSRIALLASDNACCLGYFNLHNPLIMTCVAQTLQKKTYEYVFDPPKTRIKQSATTFLKSASNIGHHNKLLCLGPFQVSQGTTRIL